MKKFIAMLLALTMALSMVGTAWAEGAASVAPVQLPTAVDGVVTLEATDYGQITDGALADVTKIVGVAGATVAGVMLTDPVNGLTFEEVTFTGDVGVQNDIDGLTFDGCVFKKNAGMYLINAHVSSAYTAKNVTVTGCYFEGTGNGDAFLDSATDETAIQIQHVNGDVTVTNNIIDGADWNGIQIEGSGNFVVTGNTISNTGSRSMRLKDASSVVVTGNILSNANQNPNELAENTNNGKVEVVKVTGAAVTGADFSGNTYNGAVVAFDNGFAYAPVAKIGNVGYDTLAEAIEAGDTVTLLGNVTLDTQIVIDKDVTIVSDTAVTVDTGSIAEAFKVTAGKLTAGKTVTLSGSNSVIEIYGGECVIDGATVTSSSNANCTIGVDEAEAVLTVKSGTVTSTGSDGSAIGMLDGTVNIQGGTISVNSNPGRATVFNHGGTINVTGGTITNEGTGTSLLASGTNAAVNVSGGYVEDVRVHEENGGSITITGGTFSADPKAYVADGYAAFELTDGGFFVAETCKVSFDAGDGTGDMGESTLAINSKYTLPECGFAAPKDKQFKAWSVDGKEYAVGAEITVAADVTVTAVWMNAPVAVEDDVMVQVTDPVMIPNPELKDEEKAVADEVKVSEICTDAMTEVVEDVAKVDVSKTVIEEKAAELDALIPEDVSAEDVVVVVQTNFEVKVEAVSVEGDKTTVTLDITPVYQKVVTTEAIANSGAKIEAGENAVVAEKGELDLKGKDVEITIAIPEALVTPDGDGFKPLYVTHTKEETGTKYVYEATVKQVGAGYTATFVNPNGFSSFSVSTVNNTTVTMNGMNYVDLQSAINDLGKDAVITVLAGNQQAEVAGNASFTVVLENGATATITAADGYRVRENNGKYTVSKIYYGGYYVGGTTTTETETEKDLVTSPDTFDAGIAMSVAVSVLGATGSAWLLRKKED